MPRLDWEGDVRPVLTAVKVALDETDDLVRGASHESVHVALGSCAVSDQVTFAALEELRRLDYIEGNVGFGDPPKMFMIKLMEKGRQEVSGWPVTPGGDYGAKFIDELERRIGDTPEGPERTRLVRMRDAAVDVGKGIITGVLIDLARGI